MWRLRIYLIDLLKAGVVLECLESSTIRLPEELQPRGDDSAVSAVLVLIAANSTQEDALGGLARLEVIDIEQSDRTIRFLLGLCNLAIRKLDKALDYVLDAGNARVLRDVLVLHETLLGGPAFPQLDAELDKSHHDRLE